MRCGAEGQRSSGNCNIRVCQRFSATKPSRDSNARSPGEREKLEPQRQPGSVRRNTIC